MSTTLAYKLAESDEEFEAIHRLNYRTFVEEIPQHSPNAQRRLVDRFHAENTYAICVIDGCVVGMIAGRAARPFSLDAKLPDLDAHLPSHTRVVEIRLLAVDRQYRKHSVFAHLAGTLANHFRAQGCDLAIISGTLREMRLYRHLGFRPFGPLVGDERAPYQPMYLTLPEYAANVAHLEVVGGRSVTNLMPGPVAVRDEVMRAMAQPAISHRSPEFHQLMQQVHERLCEMSGACGAVLMPGSGTLANDAVGAQLAAQGGAGLVLANGEFGERLADHAHRLGLTFEILRADWGAGFNQTALAAAMRRGRPRWMWAVACETSTGVRNDTPNLRTLCREHGVSLCLDAISAFGLQPLDLAGVHLASATSGKALGALPGIAIVLHDGQLAPAGLVARSLDLDAYRAAGGVAYTQPSNLVAALGAALARDWPARWQTVQHADEALRKALQAQGLPVLATEGDAMPGVLTLAIPGSLDAQRLARRMERQGYQLAHRSGYLVQRNWLQICLMGEWEARALEILPEVLATQVQALQRDGERGHSQAA
jgi:aspartate aminotransferase-like enzyme/GNAT superfamily N-acetyltransferase